MESSADERVTEAHHSRALRVIDVTYRDGVRDLTDPLDIRLIQARARGLLAELEVAVLLDASSEAILDAIARLRESVEGWGRTPQALPTPE